MPPSRIVSVVGFALFVFLAYMLPNHLLPSISQTRNPTIMNKGVIIVGSGLAGLSAASELAARNVPVYILERLPKPGGNSIKASSGINGAPTRFQSSEDTEFYSDSVRSAGQAMTTFRDRREKLISTLTELSSSAVNWLVDEKGIDLSHVAQLGGHSRPRTHRGTGQTPPGAAIVLTLLNEIKANHHVQLRTSSVVTKVLCDKGEVTGVEYTHQGRTRTIHGPVIFASGGFAGDSAGLLAKYRPDLAGFPSTNEAQPGSANLLKEVGAHLLDMRQVQVHPTGFVDPVDPFKITKFLAAEMLRGEGGLLLLNSKRFVNELETRKVVTDAILSTPPMDLSPRQWDVKIVIDEATYHAAKAHVDFYVFKGLMKRTNIAEGLGEAAIPSLQEFANAARGKAEDSFGRTQFGNWALTDVKSESVIYVGRVTPVVHYTMGGVLFNERSEVLDEEGRVIKGLWAAGEATGGIHGANRLGGSSLLECVVYGRIAGKEVSKFVQERQGRE